MACTFCGPPPRTLPQAIGGRAAPPGVAGWGRSVPWKSSFSAVCRLAWKRVLRRDARGLFHDGKAHAGLVTVLFRDHAPGVLGFFSGLERTLNLGRAAHERVQVQRADLAANHPEIAAFGHVSLLLA